MILLISVVSSRLFFLIVKIFLNKIWYRFVVFWVYEIKMIFNVKNELKIILIVVLFFNWFCCVMKLIIVVVNILKVVVLKM